MKSLRAGRLVQTALRTALAPGRAILQEPSSLLGAYPLVQVLPQDSKISRSVMPPWPVATSINTLTSFRAFSSSLPEELAGIRGEVVVFPLAQTGEGIAECELVSWHVAAGDEVEAFQPLCEVQSDKATVEITSRYTGRILTLHHKVGAMVPTGAPLVDIELPPGERPGGSPAEPPAQSSESEADRPAAAVATPVQTEQTPAQRGPVLTSPAVRALAREHRLDLSTVEGSGPGGRITKADVLKILEGPHAPDAAAAQAVVTTEGTATPRVSHSGARTVEEKPSRGDIDAILEDGGDAEAFERVSLRGYARAMVRAMTEANKVPHFYFCDEVCMDAIIALRARLKAENNSTRVTALPFILKAASLALEDYPAINSQLSECQTEVHNFKAHNLGVAIATKNGLVVPNVKNVNKKSIQELSDELVQLQELAAAGRLTPEHLSGGTLTVSNIGAIGGTYAMPLVNCPEVAIVALGRARSVLKYAPDGSITSSAMMNVSWGADHRVVDGATLANFSNRWKQLLEDPQKMLLCLR